MYYRHCLPLIALLACSMASSFSSTTAAHRIAALQQRRTKRRSNQSLNLLSRGGADEEKRADSSNETVPEFLTDKPSTEAAIVSNATENNLLGPKATPPGFLRQKLPTLPWHRLPDILTYMRCLAIPALVAVFYLPNKHILTSLLFASASATDWLDGYLARRWDITSAFGAFLDPVADKLMVSTALILLAGRYGPRTAIPAAIILAREISVSALREWMASKGMRNVVQVGYQGKVKTALTMVSLTLLLLVPENGAGTLGKLLQPSLVLLYLCTIITVTSGSGYFQTAAPILFERETS